METEQDKSVAEKIDAIKENIYNAVKVSDKTKRTVLVPVTKRIKKALITQAYDHGERHFGENYFQSLKRRAKSLPADIQWHFIGHLQSNKAKGLAEIPNLFVVETVDSFKLAKTLNSACSKLGRKLRVFVQVHSSAEATKSGVSPDECLELVGQIVAECPSLTVAGLMSIGEVGDLAGFELMHSLKLQICEKYEFDVDEFELSIGTSADYEDAIKVGGATEVRVGTQIFGYRVDKNMNTSSEEEENKLKLTGEND